MRRIKFIWDFYGPSAFDTAKHHEIHLKDYCRMEALSEWESGHKMMSEDHAIATLVISEAHLKQIRDRLKPHRAVVA
ncbi:hypothetical protein [Robertkochia flava]|uniref:hypothetical protein n=1 Tax=Robertkochia flava TaxID=3447986 RepID=UPI001CCC9684|nr:hypothetical protein [Robertkochia marina]